MRTCLLFASLLLAFLVTGSCSSRITGVGQVFHPVVQATDVPQKFNLQLDFRKHHFSGLLVVRQMEDDEIRLIAVTHFGLSIFDFSFRGGEFVVNSCVEPLRKKKILKLLETDFRQLFLPVGKVRIKEKSTTFEARKNGCGVTKSTIRLSAYADGQPESINIRHPWLKLGIGLDKLNAK